MARSRSASFSRLASCSRIARSAITAEADTGGSNVADLTAAAGSPERACGVFAAGGAVLRDAPAGVSDAPAITTRTEQSRKRCSPLAEKMVAGPDSAPFFNSSMCTFRHLPVLRAAQDSTVHRD